MPDGITINATTGVISGIPSTLSEGGTATITVKDAVVSTKSIEIMYGQVRNLLDTDIDVVSIDNIQTPLIDNPVMLDSDVSSYFSPVLGSNKYVFYALSWDEDGTHIWYSTNFNASKSYSVYITIQANEGYSFIGMSSITAKINGNDATPMEKEGGMLTIKYDFGMPVNNPAQYSISYESGGGSGSMPEATAYQERLFTLPDCTFIAPEHKQFKAWKIGDTEYEVGDKYVFTGDGVITAVWEPKKYTVTFNKGSGEGVVPGDVKTHDIDYTVPDDNYYYLGKTGYKQYGWKLGSESLDGTGAVTTITSNEDIALYPVWRPLVYKIYYTSCSGWGSLPPAGDKIYGKAYTVSTDYSLEMTDYTQVGWGFTESFDGTGGVATITNNENVWLKPIWIITPAVKSINIFPIMPNIQKGTSEQFDVSIVVVGGASDAVTWSVQGGVSGTTISNAGLLSISADETANYLRVEVTSSFNPTKIASAIVTVKDAPIVKNLVTVNSGSGGAKYEKSATVAERVLRRVTKEQ